MKSGTMEGIKQFGFAKSTITLSTIASILFGSIVVYSYLAFINQENIFSIVIWQPVVFISITIFFLFYLLILSISFFIPHIKIYYLKEKRLFFVKLFLFEFFFPFFSFLFIFFYDFPKNSFVNLYIEYVVLIIIFLPFTVNVLYWFCCKGKRVLPKKWKMKITYKEFVDCNLMSLGLIVLFIMHGFYFGIFDILNWVDEEKSNSTLIFYLSLLIANILISPLFISFKNKFKKSGYGIFIVPILSLIIYVFILLSVSNFHQKILYLAKFVEIPKYSSWYLLSNNLQEDFYFKKTSVISKSTLEKLKENFVCMPEEVNECSKAGKYNPNALYGYMAWNLGETKVFCPQSVKFGDEQNKNKLNARKCLVIEGKYLQALDAQYISQSLYIDGLKDHK